MWPANFGRKPPHFISGKVISDSGNIPLRPHDMTQIAHTEIGMRIVLQKPPGRARVTGLRSRMPAQAFDQHRSTRLLRARERGPHCTFPGSIAASLAVETRRRSPSMENPLLPARTEGTSPWINPCPFQERRTCLLSSTFHTVRAVPPFRMWPSLAFTRLRERVRGANTNMCRILRLKRNKPLLPAHSYPAQHVMESAYRPPYAFRAAWASCWLCFPCREKHHSCSLLRGIYSHAFLIQPAILPRPSEARVDNPALPSTHDSPHAPGLGLAWERGSLCSSSLTAAPHALIYFRNNQTKRRVGTK